MLNKEYIKINSLEKFIKIIEEFNYLNLEFPLEVRKTNSTLYEEYHGRQVQRTCVILDYSLSNGIITYWFSETCKEDKKGFINLNSPLMMYLEPKLQGKDNSHPKVKFIK